MSFKVKAILRRCTRSSSTSIQSRAIRNAFFSTTSTHAGALTRVCIVGSGPSGFYTAKYLLREHAHVQVDMFESLPTPFGLVRSGVAPDHPEVKSVMNDFNQIATDARFHFCGNVHVGQDVSIAELRPYYNAIILAYGAAADQPLGISEEGRLENIMSARSFVNWYNGHPDFQDLAMDLNVETAVILGNGNVALDCCRILSKSIDELAKTDISAQAQARLATSQIKHVQIVGRRGSVQAAFTIKELRELTKVRHVQCLVDPVELDAGLTRSSREEIATSRAKKRIHDLLVKMSSDYPRETSTTDRQIHFRFLKSPVAFLPHAQAPQRIGGVTVERMELHGPPNHQKAKGMGTFEDIPCGLVLKSIGYQSKPIAGMPFDSTKSICSNKAGRGIDHQTGERIPGIYCAGWLKRGPSGIIGTNIMDAKETVHSLLEDVQEGKILKVDALGGIAAIAKHIRKNHPSKQLISWEHVKQIDAYEVEQGKLVGKPREKVTNVEQMLDIIQKGKLPQH